MCPATEINSVAQPVQIEFILGPRPRLGPTVTAVAHERGMLLGGTVQRFRSRQGGKAGIDDMLQQIFHCNKRHRPSASSLPFAPLQSAARIPRARKTCSRVIFFQFMFFLFFLRPRTTRSRRFRGARLPFPASSERAAALLRETHGATQQQVAPRNASLELSSHVPDNVDLVGGGRGRREARGEPGQDDTAGRCCASRA